MKHRPKKLLSALLTLTMAFFLFAALPLTACTASSAPTITGPVSTTLSVGYAATYSAVFTVTGDPAPTVTIDSGNASITWDSTENRLIFAEGLAAGTYPVTLKASNGTSPDATFTVTLVVA